MFALALSVLLETRLAALESGLSTAAEASPRPLECRASANGEGGVWLRLRGADAQHYCELLGRGYARLTQTPQEALSAAQAAERLAGTLPAVRVLIGRAQLRLGQAGIAYEQCALAEASDVRAFADPKALHDYARAASLAQKSVEALRLYRMLVSRAALLDDPRERSACQIEAAAHVIALVPSGTDEALGYLTQAGRQSLGLSPWINALRLLAARRGGPVDQRGPGIAWPSAASLGPVPVLGFSDELPLLPAGQWEALRAMLSEHGNLHPKPAAGRKSKNP
jgi:hypothetical protein